MLKVLGKVEEDSSGELKETEVLFEENDKGERSKLDDSAPQVEELQKIFSKYKDESGLGKLIIRI